MSKQACGLCGKDPATGWAAIGDVRFCHGDDDQEPTCYMRSQGMLLAGRRSEGGEWRVETLPPQPSGGRDYEEPA